MKQLICFIILFYSIGVNAQQKFEREYRLSHKEVPKLVKDLVFAHFPVKKVKWYAEQSNDGNTIEAKLCYLKHNYSIEFSTEGKLLDIEKTIAKRKLSTSELNRIENALSKAFKVFKLKKIQYQFLTIEAFKTNTKHAYELIIKGKKDNSWALYEVLIDTSGTLVKTLQFSEANTDNLEF